MLAFGLQTRRRTNALEIAIELVLELIGGVIRRRARWPWAEFSQTELTQIQLGDIQVDDPYEVILRDQVLQRDREQAGLRNSPRK
ncbi:hypothetical protein PPS11_02788 [Pseudomonas putida S11]|nr:hypothetical protein PPS11_02788 [Pseudomonas putida S11]